ncbi:MAG: translocation/assembly module TamB domain-containing protein, partial [Vicingaceae bacterium]
TDKIAMDGVVTFHDIRFTSTFLGETYRLTQEQIEFSKNTIQFNDFTLTDSSGQTFITNGKVGVKKLANPTFDLAIKIDHFRFLNSTKANSDFIYGNVFASADIKLKGNLKRPKANATLGLEKGTDITFVVPESEATAINREGIVEFVDKHEKISPLLKKDKQEDSMKVDIMGIEFSSVINVNKEAKLTIIIDPITEDRLVVKGGGEVRLDIDPSGRINMNGIYEITEGGYEIRLYNLVKREFILKPGSKLSWNGEPLRAEMDIEGVYTAKTSPLGLLGNQISNLTEAERNQYKKRIPFNVLLMLGGEIMKPDIRFKIEVPDDQKASVDGAILSRLNQLNQNESELNKQVFSFIVLKRFYSQDPFAGGGSGSYAARESVSQILNNQLNSLTDKYVKGVKVELNVDSYNEYSEGGEAQGATDLNLSLSKSLFDERVTVKVDGDLNVEDSDQSRSNAVAGDVSVEYKITEDGKYRFKIFRKEEYEGLIEGEYTETGASLIYTKKFLKFKDLFKKIKEEEGEDE